MSSWYRNSREKFVEDDIVMYNDINRSVEFLRDIELDLPWDDDQTDLGG